MVWNTLGQRITGSLSRGKVIQERNLSLVLELALPQEVSPAASVGQVSRDDTAPFFSFLPKPADLSSRYDKTEIFCVMLFVTLLHKDGTRALPPEMFVSQRKDVTNAL